MPTTSLGIPYPASTDQPRVWEDLQDLANEVDDLLVAKSSEKPVCRLVQQTTQSIPDNTNTALSFGTSSEEIDTHNFHSEITNNTRIIPNIPGVYTFRGAYFCGAQTSPNNNEVFVRKNGTTGLAAAGRSSGSTISNVIATSGSVSMNGTTDYVELIAKQDSAGAVSTNVSLHFSSAFELVWERDL